MNIRQAELRDAGEIADIYNHYIATSHATFELDLIDRDEMERRMADGFERNYPFLVCEDNGGAILGYAYGHQYRPRAAYRHSIEISVYIKEANTDRGIATALYERLIPEILAAGFHAIIAGIALPNDASIRLHEHFGFEKAAHFRQVGRKFDRWFDVGYWELLNTTEDQTETRSIHSL